MPLPDKVRTLDNSFLMTSIFGLLGLRHFLVMYRVEVNAKSTHLNVEGRFVILPALEVSTICSKTFEITFLCTFGSRYVFLVKFTFILNSQLQKRAAR